MWSLSPKGPLKWAHRLWIVLKTLVSDTILGYFLYWIFCTNRRMLAYLLLLLTTLLFILWMGGAWESGGGRRSLEGVDYSKLVSLSHIPPLLLKLCNLLPINGHEGEAPKVAMQLRGIVVVTRHGGVNPKDQTDTKLSSISTCNPPDKFDAELISQFHKFRSSGSLKKYLLVDPDFQQLSSGDSGADNSNSCQVGYLTGQSLAQVIRLGEYLKGKYDYWNFFDSDLLTNVTFWSTVEPAPYQSALGFVYGLVKDHHGVGVLSKSLFELKSSLLSYFCYQEWCRCRNLKVLRRKHEQERKDYFKTSANNKIRTTMHRIANDILTIPGPSISSRPWALYDILLNDFVCRRKAMPCRSGKCVGVEEVEGVGKDLRDMHVDLLNSSAATQTAVVESLPILQQVLEILHSNKTLRKNKSFHLYSGKENTIVHLLSVLEGFDGTTPAYGSRLIFEIYQIGKLATANDQTFLKVIYDGVDITSNLGFCKNVSVRFDSVIFCPAKTFVYFVNTGIFKTLTIIDKSLNGICL